MYDMAELDKELEAYNAEAQPKKEETVQEEKTYRRTEMGYWQPSFTEESEEDREAEEAEERYQMFLNHLSVVKNKLDRRMEDARTKYMHVDVDRKRERAAVVREIIGTSLFFILLGCALYLCKDTAIWSAFLVLLIAFVAFMILEFRQVLNRFASYRVKCLKKSNRFVEKNKVNTYAKQEEHWQAVMDKITERLKKVEVFERKLERNRVFTEEDEREMDTLGFVEDHPSDYTTEKVTLAEYLSFWIFGSEDE